ncbi:helix-turn-helix domain-containing protein [Bacillus thuringiensis]|uniref:helix-turn-helix domain-containing protein n=1 Tax=Bacillus thuringiensis TaxID=1428 RepID=UPI00119DB293|nr:helix-turn-helix transcriptional regulator [Bacillus thuringiensis]
MTIGSNIKRLRKERRMSQTDLAKRLGIKHSAISAWEIGRNEPLMGNIEKMAIIFNVPKSEIIGEDLINQVKESLDQEKAVELKEIVDKIKELSPDQLKSFSDMIDPILKMIKK